MPTFRRHAITLVETLVVLGIIGVLLSIMIPAIQRVRESASSTVCKNNLRQIGTALHVFHETHGKLPRLPARLSDPNDPNLLLSWMTHLLPYLEQEQLYRVSLEACRVDPDPYHNPPHVGLATVIQVYGCPTDGRVRQAMTDAQGIHAAFTSYIGIAGTFPRNQTRGFAGVLSGGCRFSDIYDGLSHTIAVGERPPPDSLQAGWWYQGYFGDARMNRGPQNILVLGGVLSGPDEPCLPSRRAMGPGRTDNPCDRFHLWSMHPGGANFLFADNSVRFLRYSQELLVMDLGSRDGGEAVDLHD